MPVVLIEIEVAEAIAFAEPEEIPVLQEDHRFGRLYIFAVGFGKEGLDKRAGSGIVTVHLHGGIIAAYHGYIDRSAIGTPGDIGEVLIAGLSGFEVDGAVALQVVYAQCHLMTFLPGHGIADAFAYSRRRFYFGNERVFRNHGLVHAVESDLIPVGRPEDSFIDTEFIAVRGLPVQNVFVLFVADVLLPAICRQPEVLLQGISHTQTVGRYLGVHSFFRVFVERLEQLTQQVIGDPFVITDENKF